MLSGPITSWCSRTIQSTAGIKIAVRLYSCGETKIAYTRVARIFADYVTGKLGLSVILTTAKTKVAKFNCDRNVSVCFIMSSDSSTVKTSEKFWAILKKLKNFCGNIQTNFQFFTPIFWPRISSSTSPIFTIYFPTRIFHVYFLTANFFTD